MKKTILTILLASGIWSLMAQTTTTLPLALRMDLQTWIRLEPSDYLACGKVGILDITVRSFDVYKTSSGQCYVNYTNSRGTVSRKYLGYKLDGVQEFEGNTVFFSSDTAKAWIWTVDRYGQIYKMDMPDWVATNTKNSLNDLTK
jgi:hypothetical protein